MKRDRSASRPPRIICLFLLFSTCYGGSICLAQSKAGEVYKKVSPSVVVIRTDKGTGTGFIVTPDGVIATAYHVVDGVSAAKVVMASGEVFDDVALLAKDERKDIAILKIKGFDLPTAKLGNSNNVSPGDSIIVIGNSLGLRASVSDGIVSGIRQVGDGYKVIQMTAAISPGNSGGPVMSTEGEVVGIVVFYIEGGQNINFALPVN